jgi:hypothetical protein
MRLSWLMDRKITQLQNEWKNASFLKRRQLFASEVSQREQSSYAYSNDERERRVLYNVIALTAFYGESGATAGLIIVVYLWRAT